MSKQPARTKPSAKDDDVFAAATPPFANEQASPAASETLAEPTKKPDGRNLHVTGRTHQFATRIREDTHKKMIEIVKREKADGQPRFTLAELIELAIEAYERERTDRL